MLSLSVCLLTEQMSIIPLRYPHFEINIYQSVILYPTASVIVIQSTWLMLVGVNLLRNKNTQSTTRIQLVVC